jgi:hypothetical protein
MQLLMMFGQKQKTFIIILVVRCISANIVGLKNNVKLDYVVIVINFKAITANGLGIYVANHIVNNWVVLKTRIL